MKTMKTQRTEGNNENNSKHNSSIQQRNRITKENQNWNKIGNEKFRKSNKTLRGKPHQQIKRHGRENFRAWRPAIADKENVKSKTNQQKPGTKHPENLGHYEKTKPTSNRYRVRRKENAQKISLTKS